MNRSCGIHYTTRPNERGGARLKFLIVIALVALIFYAGYQYVPVALQAYQYKDFMQQSVDKAAAMGQTDDWLATQLRATGGDYGVPPDASITVTHREGRLEARVQYVHQIQLPGYTYQYDFDHTATSSSWFNK